MTQFTVSVVLDTVCPFCYLGKKKLDMGIAAYQRAHPSSGDTFTTTFLPYYLDPAAPQKGVNNLEWHHAKFGAERTSMMFGRVRDIGKEVDIDFKFGGKIGASRDSHRLIHLGKTKGPEVQARVVEEILKSYFEDEGDITSHEMLQKAGVNAGLDELEVKRFLESDKGGAQVDQEVMEARARGVSGVPNFILQGKYEIGGAQEAGSFVKVFERIKELEKGN